MEPRDSGRRDLLRGAAALLADAWLPRPALPAAPSTETRAIVVTFGGGVRWEDTSAPEGWPNIPHLVKDLVPQGLFFPEARYDGLTGHFNATGALVTGCVQNVDAYGGEAPTTPTIFECLRKERRLPPEAAWVVGLPNAPARGLSLDRIITIELPLPHLVGHSRGAPHERAPHVRAGSKEAGFS